MSAVNLVLLGLALGTTSIAAALSNAATSLGLISIVFYGITAAAALRHLRAGPGSRRAFAGAFLPLIGALFSAFVLIGSLATGVFSPTVAAYGLGSIAVGALIALLLRSKGARFFAPLRDESRL